MKIALVNTISPFIRGGAEILVDDLQEQLVKRGHDVELFRLPFPNEYEIQLLELVLASKLLDFSAYDQVIAFKFPAYCVCHRHKKLWIFHQFRQVYDLFSIDIPDNEKYRALRELISQLDVKDMLAAERLLVIGKENQDRMLLYNNIKPDIVFPPLPNKEKYFCSDCKDYIYYPSRVNVTKRQHLAVEAMYYVKTNVKLILSGKCEDIEYERKLQNIIKKNNLQDKVIYQNSWIKEEEKLKLLAESLGVMFIPYKEDYGFVTLEAFYSSKPLITCTDSGTPCFFLENSGNGYLTEPTPQALAKKMDYLFMHRDLAKQMGENARKDILARNITWDETVRRLLS